MLLLLGVVGRVSSLASSQSDCPRSSARGNWTFREGRCYLLSSSSFDFETCNAVFCASFNATLACARDGAENGFLARDVGGGARASWLGRYQRAGRPPAEGWNRQSSSTCASTYANWKNNAPDDFMGCDENCAAMGVDGDDRWDDVDCGRAARCLCEYPGAPPADYAPPPVVTTCAWWSLGEYLFVISLFGLAAGLGLVALVLKTNAPGAPAGAASPMVGLLPAVRPGGYVLVRSGFEGGPPRESEHVLRLCRVVLQLLVSLTALNVAMKVALFVLLLFYLVNVQVYAAGFATSAAVLVVSVGAAAVGVVGVRTRNEPKVARFGYLHAFACLNALLILLWTAALGETAANLVKNRGPAPELFSSTYHDLVFDATFLFGHAVVARATAQLLAAIRDLNALDGPDGQGYHLQGDADAYQHDDGETLTHL